MKSFGKPAGQSVSGDVNATDPISGRVPASADAILKMRVACLQEAIKRSGANDMRVVLVIAKEYETWCLTGDNEAARLAVEQATQAAAPAPVGESGD